MEQYNRELFRLQQRAVTQPAVETSQKVEASAPLPATEHSVFTAPLTIRATSANGAVPIADALVIVTREENGQEVVQASRLTNQSGLTEPVILPAVDPALTLTPGNAIPSLVYDVTVAAPDYYRARIRSIPLYGGIPTELPVSLVPLPEFADGANSEIQYDTPPIDL